jgi:type II secretory pathway pseudopilin PulG
MRSEQGFSYVIVMFLVAVLSVISVRALQNTLTTDRRDKEAELLAVGTAYRRAIADYVEMSPGSVKAYPRELSDLLLDQRRARLARPLRKLYRDPVTGRPDWGVVRSPDGGVMGIYSLSDASPIKREGFASELVGFAGARRYSDWKFVYTASRK